MQYTITNRVLSVTVNLLGAEIVSIKKHNKELLWQNQTGEWQGHSPILFPVCGNCAVVVDGKKYPMPKHGFARRAQFELVQVREDSVKLVLKHNVQTKEVYPFKFEFIAEFLLDDNALEVVWTVKNVDEKPIYFYFGGHEAHYLEKNLSEYKLVFEKEEVFDSLHFANGFLLDSATSYGQGTTLNIPLEGLVNQETIILGNVNSRRVKLVDGDIDILSETFEGFSHLLLWSPDGNRALCIEPWQNLPDDKRTSQMEFSQKPCINKVLAGESKTVKRKIIYN